MIKLTLTMSQSYRAYTPAVVVVGVSEAPKQVAAHLGIQAVHVNVTCTVKMHVACYCLSNLQLGTAFTEAHASACSIGSW